MLRRLTILTIAIGFAAAARAETIAVVGDMTPAARVDVGEGYAKRVRDELALLKPEVTVWAGEIEKNKSELVGETQVISLDGRTGAIGDPQLVWLRRELDRVFAGRKARWVVVALNRPVYLEKESDWDKVHALLVEFNRRPIVSVEGRGTIAKGPRVWGVLAAGSSAYALEPSRDDVAYMTLGPAGARLAGDSAVVLRHYTVLKSDETGITPALVPMGDVPGPKSGPESRRVLPMDVITRAERDVLDALQAIDEKTLGIDGVVEQPTGSEKDVGVQNTLGAQRISLGNNTKVPITVSVRLASAENFTATDREQVNKDVEGLDLPWELHVPYLSRHLKPGVQERWRMSLFAKASKGHDVPPPQVEFVVNWEDERGRGHKVVLKRRVALVNRKVVEIGTRGVSGQLYAWDMGVAETIGLPTLQFTATKDLLRVKVTPENVRGGETVEVAWVRAGKVQTRTVVGAKLEVDVTHAEFGPLNEPVAINVTLRGKDANGREYRRSWAKGEPKLGDETAWGFVTVKPPAPSATQPARQQPSENKT